MKDIIQFSHFMQFPQLVHGFSTRKLGSMLKERGVIEEEHVRKFAETLGIDPRQIIFSKQVHGNSVAIVSHESERMIPDTDGLITKDTNIFLAMATADCLPILFFDPENRATGIVHAGFKGLLRGILEHEIKTLQQLGSSTGDIMVGIGPAIDVCCYNVPKERVELFGTTYPFLQNYFLQKGETYYLDIKQIASQILQHVGISNSHIAISSFCTCSESDSFFSFRGDSYEIMGECAAIIGFKAE